MTYQNSEEQEKLLKDTEGRQQDWLARKEMQRAVHIAQGNDDVAEALADGICIFKESLDKKPVADPQGNMFIGVNREMRRRVKRSKKRWP